MGQGQGVTVNNAPLKVNTTDFVQNKANTILHWNKDTETNESYSNLYPSD